MAPPIKYKTAAERQAARTTEAKRAYSALGRRGITAELCGDPLPGRSALDQRKG